MKKAILWGVILSVHFAQAQEGRSNDKKETKVLEQISHVKVSEDRGKLISAILKNEQKINPDILKAVGSEGVGGGDEIALEFQERLSEAIEKIKKIDQGPNKNFFEVELLKFSQNISVVIVDSVLDVSLKNFVQNSAAVNIPDINMVIVNRRRWQSIGNKNTQSAIALHEILSLKNMERTGYYPYSSKLMGLNNDSKKSVQDYLSVDPLRQIQAMNPQDNAYQILKKLHEQANSPISFDDFDEATNDKSNMECQFVEADKPEKLNLNYFAKVPVVLKDAVPAQAGRGPLFPAEPAKPAVMGWDLVVGGALKGLETLYSPNQDMKVNETSIKFHSLSDYPWVLKKNNSYITYKLNHQSELSESNVLYGYCYRK